MAVGTDSISNHDRVVEGDFGVDRPVNGEVQDVYTDEQLVAAIRDEAEKAATSPLGLENAIKAAHERGLDVKGIAQEAGWTQDAVKKLVSPAKDEKETAKA